MHRLTVVDIDVRGAAVDVGEQDSMLARDDGAVDVGVVVGGCEFLLEVAARGPADGVPGPVQRYIELARGQGIVSLAVPQRNAEDA